MKIEVFIEKVKKGERVAFKETMAAVEENYIYTPVQFSNGLGDDPVVNPAGKNEGSCKIFALGRRCGLSKEETVSLFGELYWKDVVENPDGIEPVRDIAGVAVKEKDYPPSCVRRHIPAVELNGIRGVYAYIFILQADVAWHWDKPCANRRKHSHLHASSRNNRDTDGCSRRGNPPHADSSTCCFHSEI